jgi:N-acetylglutamate synthase
METLERSAFDAWPAEEVESQAGWRLRATRGVTRRANSVWTFEATGEACAEERVAYAEAWYTSRHLAPTFQVTDRSRPEGLDSVLAQRGYVVDAPVSIQTAATSDVLATTSRGDAIGRETCVSRACSDEWFELSAHRGRFARVAGIYRELLQRIGSGARFALARVDGQPVAVGLGVVDRGWMGIFAMLTLPSVRRAGAARAVLAGLADSARDEGIEALYLQVERGNAAAIALYAGATFRELYGYHYRVGADPGAV